MKVESMEKINKNIVELIDSGKDISEETLKILLEKIKAVNEEEVNYVQKLSKRIVMTNLGFLVRNRKRLIQAEFVSKKSKIALYEGDSINLNEENLYSPIAIHEDVKMNENFKLRAAEYLLNVEKDLYSEDNLDIEIEKSGILVK